MEQIFSTHMVLAVQYYTARANSIEPSPSTVTNGSSVNSQAVIQSFLETIPFLEFFHQFFKHILPTQKPDSIISEFLAFCHCKMYEKPINPTELSYLVKLQLESKRIKLIMS